MGRRSKGLFANIEPDGDDAGLRQAILKELGINEKSWEKGERDRITSPKRNAVSADRPTILQEPNPVKRNKRGSR